MKYKRLADDKIGYVYYGSFSSGVGDNSYYMFAHFKGCKGLIFDVRDNGGGSMLYSDRIASRFLEERILTGYTQYKKGNGHNDFTQPSPVYLSPSDRIRWPYPVVVLTNRHSYSATNDFVNVMRSFRKSRSWVTVREAAAACLSVRNYRTDGASVSRPARSWM